MKLDLHVHSIYSPDATCEVKELIKKAKLIGLDGIAVVDHNNIKGAAAALEYAKGIENFVVLPGAEISTVKGHLLGLGIKENIPSMQEPEEAVEQIISLGGIAVIPHPYRMVSGLKLKKIKNLDFAGVEVFNSRSWRFENANALQLADKLNKGRTGGSDCHSITELGYGITEFKVESYDYRNLIEYIAKGETICYGKYISILRLLKQQGSNVVEFLKRGCKRI